MNTSYIYLILIIICLSLLGIFIMRKVMKNKEKKKNEMENQLANMESNLSNKSKIASNDIKIKIFRDAGGGTVAQAAKFYAKEQNDQNNNLFAINDEHKFKENLEFTKDRIYEAINLDLKLGDRPKKEQAQIVYKKIKEQEELLDKINRNIDLNAKYNYSDEDLKLKQLKVFLDTLKRSDRGSYLTWEESGIRTYYFKAVDGILYPYWWDNSKMRLDPDRTIKKKIYVHEKIVYNAENAQLNKIINWTGLILCVIGALMLITGGVLHYKYWKKSTDIEMEIQEASLKCSNTLASCTESYNELRKMEFYTQLTENNINQEAQNNNIDLKPKGNTLK